eukprot:2229011-Pleurochrysis_carterae.AAC.1
MEAKEGGPFKRALCVCAVDYLRAFAVAVERQRSCLLHSMQLLCDAWAELRSVGAARCAALLRAAHGRTRSRDTEVRAVAIHLVAKCGGSVDMEAALGSTAVGNAVDENTAAAERGCGAATAEWLSLLEESG